MYDNWRQEPRSSKLAIFRVLGCVLAGGLLAGSLLAGLGHPAIAQPAAPIEMPAGQVSGLPLPRFVSLKSDRVNVRAGPTREHHVAWIFTRSGLPVEITAEFDNWRRIRDWEGAEGWVFHSLLSGRRTAIVTAPPEKRERLLELRRRPNAEAAVVARLEPGVMGAVRQCTGGWCRISGAGFDGWAEQIRLFGVYPNEKM